MDSKKKNKIYYGGLKGNLQGKWSSLRHAVVIDVGDDAFSFLSIAKETVSDG